MRNSNKIFILILCLLGFVTGYTQTVNLSCYPGDANAINEVINNKVYTNITIPQTDSIKGYLEYLPAGYNANDPNTKYPVIIVLHVLNEFGNGTANDMCKFFANRYQRFPYTRIELGGWPTTLPTSPGVNTPFITLTPQFVNKLYTPNPVDAFIEYVKQTYNVDDRKIYLLGTSQGANVALQYVGQSETFGRKIAGVLALSPCYNLVPTDIQNIKNSNVSVWNLQCGYDKACLLPGFPLENDTIAAYNNYNKLKAAGIDDNKNVLSHLSETTGCNNNPHDTWTPTLNTTFNFSTLSTPLNVYQWLGPLTSNQILPVILKSFEVKLNNNQILLQWETTQEQNGEYFYIQRANDEMTFTTIDSLFTKNNPNGEKYQYVDLYPNFGNNYYRLLQKDIDGKVQAFDIKKITIQSKNQLIINKNPFQQELSFTILTSEADQYQILVRDLAGKIFYNENIPIQTGSKNIKINSNNWPNGMYLLSILNKSGIQTHKVLKN